MWSKWLVLIIWALPMIAAEKQRDWQTGRILESGVEQTTMAFGPLLNQQTALVNRETHSIEAADKDYLVTRPVTHGKGELTAGMTVRFAVEGKAMFISIAGKEYRLEVERVSAVALKIGSLPQPSDPAAAATREDKPAAEASEPLDNDGVVKMIVGGLKEDTVIRVIEARPGRYVVTPDAVLGLKATGVPLGVISAMSAKMETPR
jgi:hypothetical protein